MCARYATSTCEPYATGVQEKIVLAHEVPPGVMTNIMRLLRPAVAIDFFPKPSGPARIPGRVLIGPYRIFPPLDCINDASSGRFLKVIRFPNSSLSLKDSVSNPVCNPLRIHIVPIMLFPTWNKKKKIFPP